jgi:hypothetical protein
VDEHDHELYNISAACNELLNLRIISCTMIRNLEHQIRLSPVFPAITEWKCGTQLLWNTELCDSRDGHRQHREAQMQECNCTF